MFAITIWLPALYGRFSSIFHLLCENRFLPLRAAMRFYFSHLMINKPIDDFAIDNSTVDYSFDLLWSVSGSTEHTGQIKSFLSSDSVHIFYYRLLNLNCFTDLPMTFGACNGIGFCVIEYLSITMELKYFLSTPKIPIHDFIQTLVRILILSIHWIVIYAPYCPFVYSWLLLSI